MNRISPDIAPVQIDQFQQGLGQLRTRRNKMRIYLVLSVLMVALSVAAVVFNQQLVYALFEISPTINQLHIPDTALEIKQKVGEQYDAFDNLLSWLFWLLIKPFIAFIGAFIVVIYVRRWQFFKVRLQGFGKKILAWVISFILIWSGLAWLQVEMHDKNDIQKKYQYVVRYKNRIDESRMYFYIQRSPLAEPVSDYLLAQTALLRHPADIATAKHYLGKLMKHEQDNPNFQTQYDINDRQLWAMQQQVYGKPITPLAQSVQDTMPIIDSIMQYSRMIFMLLSAVFILMSALFYLITRQFSKRLERIQTQLLRE